MKPLFHLIFSLILAAVLYPIFNWKVILVIVGGVLIDIDHYLWYIFKFRRFKVSDCYKYCAALNNIEEKKGGLIIFHTIEFIFISIIFSIYSQLVLMFTVGLIPHLIADIIQRYTIAKSFISNPSLIAWIIKYKIRK